MGNIKVLSPGPVPKLAQGPCKDLSLLRRLTYFLLKKKKNKYFFIKNN